MLRRYFTLLNDLINVLPSRSPNDWTETRHINPLKPTVILVSGFAATNRTLSVMRKRLIKDGFNVLVLSLDWQTLSDGVKGLYRMAEKLSSIVLKLKKDHGMRKAKLYLVAHSAGGLVARYYIQLLGGFHYCDGLITLGTPHRGTWFAALGLCTHLILKARCLAQMTPISPFIKKINESPFPSGFKMVSIYSHDDLMCPPSATKLPELMENSPEIQSIGIKNVSHSDFLLSKETYQVVLQHLRGKEKPIPTKRSDSNHSVL